MSKIYSTQAAADRQAVELIRQGVKFVRVRYLGFGQWELAYPEKKSV